ncbi:hypothetical protein QUF74_17115 [Candidatus Halobeggiatoa sp. HSG11]|nr:hypothetical protein [Candidatus Halobeggiatoa sp. HSG11]
MNIYQENLKNILKECKKHSFRINYAHTKMTVFMPLTIDKYEKLTNEEVELIDHFLFRFSKLQDVIGQRLFPTTLLFLGEEIKTKSFIDRLNRLEQLNLINSGDDWQELRVIRNKLTHEYDDNPNTSVVALNLIYNQKDNLIGFYLKIDKQIENILYT